MTSQPDTEVAGSDPVGSGPGWLALPAILTSVFLIGLDSSAVVVALPAIQRDLHASPAALEFVASGFALTFGAGLITSGRLGDLYGRRRLFVIGMGVFVLASAAGGCAPDIGLLIGARILQGLGATLMSPQALAMLGVLYDGPRRARALNAYVLTVGLATVLGQLAGGLLILADIAGLGWRVTQLVNVPIGIVALVAVGRLVPDPRTERTSRLDPVGAVLVTGGAVSFVLPLIAGRAAEWPLWTRVVPFAAVPLAAVFIAQQRRLARGGGSPVVAPELFRQRAFSVGLAIVVVFYMAIAEFLLLYPYWLQRGQGLSPFRSGLWYLPLSCGFLVASLTARGIAGRLRRPHQVLTAASLMLACGYLLFVLTVPGGLTRIIPSQVVIGFAIGLMLTPLVPVVLKDIPARHAASASAVLSSAMQLGAATGLAVVGIVAYGAFEVGRTPAEYSSALIRSVFVLMALAVVATLLVQFLPVRQPRSAR